MRKPPDHLTRWTYGFYPAHGKNPGVLTLAQRVYNGKLQAEMAAGRACSELDCEVTPPLKVKVEIPKGMRR